MSGSSSAPYSPKCLEYEFSEVELPLYGVLRNWPRTSLGVIIGGALSG